MSVNPRKALFITAAVIILGITAVWLFTDNKPVQKTAADDNTLTNQITHSESMEEKITLNIISKTGSSKDFFESAKLEFMQRNKNIEINFIGKSTFDAIDYLIEHDDIDGWICADETASSILDSEYKKAQPGKEIIDEVTPVVTSPLVILGWEERLSKVKDINLSSIYETVVSGKSWGEIGGDKSWGFFNFSHTNAVDSNSGVQFLILLIHNYYTQIGTPKKELTVEDVTNPKVVEYVKAFEKNTAKQVEGSGKFIDSMIQFGPSKYDAGVIYEYYALSNIKNAQGRWGNLKIYYPNPTIWSSKPFVIFKGEKITAQKRKALKAFKDFLLSEEVQKQAMLEGYRPANIKVSDLTDLETKFSAYGFKKEITSSVPAPTQNVIESIRGLASRVR
jgi:hypothetical protein